MHGALSGAGATAGFMLGGIPGAMAGAAAGVFLGTLAEQAINGDPLCVGCAAKEALVEGLLAGAAGVAGKLLGPVLGRVGRALGKTSIGRAVQGAVGKAVTAVRKGVARLRGSKIPSGTRAPLPVGRLPANATNAEKGVFGEHAGDVHMYNNGHTKLSDGGQITSANDTARGTGIDGIWRNAIPPLEYIITEAKYGTSRLGTTADGPQMSDTWVTESNRLERAVGAQEAQRIRTAMRRPGGVQKQIHRVDDQGNVIVNEVGRNGSVGRQLHP